MDYPFVKGMVLAERLYQEGVEPGDGAAFCRGRLLGRAVGPGVGHPRLRYAALRGPRVGAEGGAIPGVWIGAGTMVVKASYPTPEHEAAALSVTEFFRGRP